MKAILFITTFFISSICYAQLDSVQIAKKSFHKWVFTASINSVEAQIDQKVVDAWGAYPNANLNYVGNKTNKSVSFSLTPSYLIMDDLLLRCEFGFTNIYLISHLNGENDSNATAATQYLIKDDTLQQKIFRFAPGIQWNFIHKKRMYAYCGFSVDYFHFTKSYWKDNLKSSNPTINPNYDRWTGETKGGFAAGIGAFGGFNISPIKNFSIGAEFSTALVYYKIGGMQNGLHNYGDNVIAISRSWSLADNVARGVQFLKIMPSLNISFEF